MSNSAVDVLTSAVDVTPIMDWHECLKDVAHLLHQASNTGVAALLTRSACLY